MQVCLEALQQQFPKSSRVYKLKAIGLEATGKYVLIYIFYIQFDPGNLVFVYAQMQYKQAFRILQS